MRLSTVLAAAMAVVSCDASPVAAPVQVNTARRTNTTGLIRQGLDLAQSDMAPMGSSEFDLEQSWIDDTLFDGRWEHPSGFVDLTVICNECRSKGTVNVEVWEDFFDPKLEVTFNDVEFYVDFSVAISAAQWVAIDLFASQTPIGIKVPGMTVGVVFVIDLVFSLAEELDFTGGFWVKLPEEAYIQTGLLEGDLGDANFEGTTSGSLPVSIDTGTTTFKADLRFRIQAGVEGDTSDFGIDIGAGAVVAIYANVLEYVTVFEYNTTDCAIQAAEQVNLNVGVYRRVSAVIGPTIIGETPTKSTTLLTAPTLTQCLYTGGNNSTVSVTMAPTEEAAAAKITDAPRIEHEVYSLQRCDVEAVNCPNGHGEEIVVTRTEGAAHVFATAPTAPRKTFDVATTPVRLESLATPVVNTIGVPS